LMCLVLLTVSASENETAPESAISREIITEPCFMCRVEKQWRVTTLVAEDGRTTVRRAAKRNSSGALLRHFCQDVQTLTVTEPTEPQPPLWCTCGEGWSQWRTRCDATIDEDFVDNSVVVILPLCISQRDRRVFTPEDFGLTEEEARIVSQFRISDSNWSLIQAGRWRETLVNWPQFRRIVHIELDQNCKENVLRVVRQLEQLPYVRYVGVNHRDACIELDCEGYCDGYC
jgi:hypothetical protein